MLLQAETHIRMIRAPVSTYFKKKSDSTSVTKEPIDASFVAKSLEFLAKNKYKLLILAAISYGIYDHYHENHIGKSAEAM